MPAILSTVLHCTDASELRKLLPEASGGLKLSNDVKRVYVPAILKKRY